ncbi:hypothetical protein [Acidovorax kalamii]|uniref:hypothetical protein n=1 Tax=Acidovorax kalamii TaxID=2004485 RepID=UPI0020909F2F|nr:hypothetical protein [Acidovorax kalamii]MCO5355756.1 hypothetical protein [Acidovorax kalamii]
MDSVNPISPARFTPPAAPWDAVWVVDDASSERAKRRAFVDQPGWARALAPIGIAFITWYCVSALALPVPKEQANLLSQAVELLLMFVAVALCTSQCFHAQRKRALWSFSFKGDQICWRFSAGGVQCEVLAPDGSRRHSAFSHWSLFSRLTMDTTGLCLHWRDSGGASVLPAQGFALLGQHAARVMADVAELARAAGVSVQTQPRHDLKGLAGGLLATALLVGLMATMADTVVASPYLRPAEVRAYFNSGAEIFVGWALVLAPVVLALHLGLAYLQQRRRPMLELPGKLPQLLLALIWAGALLLGLECLRAGIFSGAFALASFLMARIVCLNALGALVIGQVLYYFVVTPWAVRRFALGNDGLPRQESV